MKRRALLGGVAVSALAVGAQAGVAPPGFFDPANLVTTALPAFAMQAETTAIVAAMTATGSGTPSANRQYFIDRTVRRLKTAGVWTLLTALYMTSDVSAHSLINWKNPGANNLTQIGSPTFASPVASVGGENPLTTTKGWSSIAGSNALDTGITLASCSPTNFSASVYRSQNTTANGLLDFGALDGTGGVAIVPLNTGGSGMTARVFSASIGTIGVAANWTGNAFHAINRASGSAASGYHNAFNVATLSSATVATTTGSLTLRYITANGSSTPTPAGMLGGHVGQAMTDVQMQALYAIQRSFIETVVWGAPEIHEPGYAPQSVTADVLVHGANFEGLMAAYEAKRQGANVVIIGGWNEYTVTDLGGMSANGLSAVDINVISSLGGLARSAITRARAVNAFSDSTINFLPASMNFVMRQMFDATLGGQAVPIYFTGGVTGAVNNGATKTLRTADGRSFTGKFVIDASFEADALYQLGVPLITGREAAGSGSEAINGFRGILVGNKSSNQQFGQSPNTPGTLYSIDPYLTPGTPASGFVAGVAGNLPTEANGAADNATQAYNFRLTWRGGTSLGYIVPWSVLFSAGPPTGYSAANYELFGRLCAAMTAAGQTTTLTEMTLMVSLPTALPTYDVNNGGGMSTDLMGSGTAYVAAAQNFAQRLVVLQNVRNYMLGLFYYVLFSGDGRIPAALVIALNTYGFADDHYLDPGPNGMLFFPGAMYVREYRRLAGGIGGAIWNGNDAAAVDGAAPRISTNTVSASSYSMDSHHNERYGAVISGVTRVWNEGTIFATAGGSDQITPVPIEITMPDASVMANVCSPWTLAATHAAYGALRLEGCMGQLGQSLGYAAALGVTNGTTLQSLPYSALRAGLLATPEAIAPVLPQTT